jgi:serine/threonine-protein kinase RsbW
MRIKISLPVDKQFAKPLRDFVFAIIKKISNDEYLSESLSLAIAEAYINIWEHEKFYGNIDFSISYENGVLEFSLIDGAKKIDFRKLKSRLLSDFREGGLGLYIISSVMDEAYYEDIEKGNKLVLKKTIK